MCINFSYHWHMDCFHMQVLSGHNKLLCNLKDIYKYIVKYLECFDMNFLKHKDCQHMDQQKFHRTFLDNREDIGRDKSLVKSQEIIKKTFLFVLNVRLIY